MSKKSPEPPFPSVVCTVDVVLLTLKAQTLHVVLLQRKNAPFAGMPALPGGYIHAQEDRTAEDAANRVLRSKTGIASPYLEQLTTCASVDRDPRGWSVSIAYCALVPLELLAEDQESLQLCPVSDLPPLPFDHKAIIELAVSRVRSKSQYSSLPVYLCGEKITLPQLQAVYEAVLGEPINKVSFRRKMDELDMLEPIKGKLQTGAAHRPAQVYQLRPQFHRILSMAQRGLNM